MKNIKITTMKLQTPTTYGEAFVPGNSFFVTYSKLHELWSADSISECTDLLSVLDTRTTKTGRIAARFENFATGRTFWWTAKNPDTACEHLPINEGMATTNWKFDGQR